MTWYSEGWVGASGQVNPFRHVTYHDGVFHVLPDVLNLLLFLSGKQKRYQAWLMKSLQRTKIPSVLCSAVHPQKPETDRWTTRSNWRWSLEVLIGYWVSCCCSVMKRHCVSSCVRYGTNLNAFSGWNVWGHVKVVTLGVKHKHDEVCLSVNITDNIPPKLHNQQCCFFSQTENLHIQTTCGWRVKKAACDWQSYKQNNNNQK